MAKVKYFFQQSWLLIVASFFFGLLIAVANAAWEGRIRQNEEDKFNNLAGEMLPEAASFEIALENAEVESGKGKKKATAVKKALSADGKCVGWAFKCEGSGFADKIKLVLAVDADFEKLRGFGVLASSETPGFGDQIKLPYFRSQFDGKPAVELVLVKTGKPDTTDSRIVAISGATVSSQAVVDIINTFVSQVKKQVKKHVQEKGLIGNGK
ncbi:MAG: FMN-binding protein [Planctomycetota bacterium]